MSAVAPLQLNDRVVHRYHGAGVVIKVQPSPGGTRYLVQFNSTAQWLYADNLKVTKVPFAAKVKR